MPGDQSDSAVDDIFVNARDVVRLAGLAVEGGASGTQTVLRRIIRQHRESHPELASDLVRLLRASPTRGQAGSAIADAVPVDVDSKMPLLRVEQFVRSADQPILPALLRKSLDQLVSEHRESDALARVGLYPSRTALLVGPPGVGKTMSARWIASELDLPLLSLDLSAVMSSFLGRTGSNVRRVLEYARTRPSVLLLDELDAVAKRRDDTGEVGELKRLVTVLLQEVDAWPEGSLLLAATNHESLLDPAVWRRFEVVLTFPLPDQDAIRSALRQHVRDGAVSDAMLDAVAEAFVGQTLADVERAVVGARRGSIVSGTSVSDLLAEMVGRRVRALPPSERGRSAARIAGVSGLSQRVVSELTGVSRDTLRKYAR